MSNCLRLYILTCDTDLCNYNICNGKIVLTNYCKMFTLLVIWAWIIQPQHKYQTRCCVWAHHLFKLFSQTLFNEHTWDNYSDIRTTPYQENGALILLKVVKLMLLHLKTEARHVGPEMVGCEIRSSVYLTLNELAAPELQTHTLRLTLCTFMAAVFRPYL